MLKLKNIDITLYCCAGSIADKSKINVSHSFATVVLTMDSTKTVLSPAFSILNKIGVPTAGEYTSTAIKVVLLKSIFSFKVTEVPAQVSDPAGLVYDATVALLLTSLGAGLSIIGTPAPSPPPKL